MKNQEDLRENLIRSLRLEGILETEVVERALRAVNREDFLWPGDPKALAYVDEPLSLGGTGQTISAPSMIVIMLECLELSNGLRVLEVGAGSGYTAALICSIVRSRRDESSVLVTTIERNNQLAKFARENLRKYGFEKTSRVAVGDGSLGYPEKSLEKMYDRIIVTAAAPEVPRFLMSQLRKKGILLVPVGGKAIQKLIKLKRLSNEQEDFEREEHGECVFVPLIGNHGFPES